VEDSEAAGDSYRLCIRLLVIHAELYSFTGLLHGTIVGPTGRSNWSVLLVGPTGQSDDQSRCSVGGTCFLRHSYIAAAVIYVSGG